MIRRTRRLGGVLLALSAAAALVVLSFAATPSSQADRLEVASVSVHEAPPGGDSGGVTGRLDAARSGDRVCFWISDSEGSAKRLYLLFARQYSATGGLALLDEQGQIIARAGEVVTVINAVPRPGAAPDFCPSGTGMTVYDVSRAASQ